MARSTRFSRNFGLLGAAIVALAAASPALADVKAGVDAWERGEFELAVTEWRDPAAKGDPDAQFNLGQAYKLGRGVPMDLKQAETWYKKAADSGHIQAADNYGLVLFQDNRREEALPYIRASAGRGEPRAQYVLGTAMFNGDIAEKDWVRAYALMTRASAQGLPQASRSLVTMDKYIPIADRTKGTQLAAQLERDALTERQKLAGAAAGLKVDPATGASTGSKPVLAAASPKPAPVTASASAKPAPAPAPAPAPIIRTPAAPSTIQTTSLPPSNANGSVIPAIPSSPTGTAANAGVDFATTASPSVSKPAPSPAAAPAPAPRVPVAAPVVAATTAPATAAPAVASAGDWRIQLGAFSEEARARTLWNSLERQNAALTGLQPYLVKAGAVTRLQAGPFATQAAAKQACDNVAKTGQPCFAVKK